MGGAAWWAALTVFVSSLKALGTSVQQKPR